MNAATFPGRAWVVLAALAVGAAACSGPGGLDKAGSPAAKPTVLTLADGEADTSNAEPFATAVSTLSHGSLQIKIEGDLRPADPNYEADLIKAVRAGKTQLGVVGSRVFDTIRIDSLQALQAPFLIDNYRLERKVLASAIPAQMLQGLRSHGVVGLALLPGPLLRPFGFTRPLVAASSYRGTRIGISPSHVSAGIFRALGAIPVVQKRPSSGKRTTRLTGIESLAEAIDSGFAVPHAVLTGNVVFEPRPSVIFMNRRAFRTLTVAQRAVLKRAAAQARTEGIYESNDTASVADLCRRGIKVVSASPAELAGLQAAMRPVYRALESNHSTRAFIDQITAMRKAAGGVPAAVTCPAAGGGANAATAPALQGTWQVTYTESELIAAGADAGSLRPSEGNWGHYTLTFRHGHWWQRLIGGDPGVTPDHREQSGTYVVTGPQITFYRHDHAYPGSDTQVWGPYTWSAYGDNLTFGLAAPPPMPLGLVVKPWRKTST